jgi:hypothetical protein
MIGGYHGYDQSHSIAFRTIMTHPSCGPCANHIQWPRNILRSESLMKGLIDIYLYLLLFHETVVVLVKILL